MTDTDTVLVRRGTVVQKWCGTRPDQIDAAAHDGELVACIGDVAPGMTYRDGRFLIAAPIITAEQIKAEAVRRAEGVFPKAVQPLLINTSAGGAMHAYLMGVHDTAQAFLGMDRAPADYTDNRYWPAVPDVSAAGVAMATPQLGPAPAGAGPQEVRVIVDHRQAPAPVLDMQPVTVPVRWEMQPPGSAAIRRDDAASTDINAANWRTNPSGAVAAELADGDELAKLKRIVKAAIEATYDVHKGEFAHTDADVAAHNAWVQQLAALFVEVDVSTTVGGVMAAKDRAEAFIRGAA